MVSDLAIGFQKLNRFRKGHAGVQLTVGDGHMHETILSDPWARLLLDEPNYSNRMNSMN